MMTRRRGRRMELGLSPNFSGKLEPDLPQEKALL